MANDITYLSLLLNEYPDAQTNYLMDLLLTAEHYREAIPAYIDGSTVLVFEVDAKFVTIYNKVSLTIGPASDNTINTLKNFVDRYISACEVPV